jgi:C4-dicarboxylate transporter/malic acid transport protein
MAVSAPPAAPGLRERNALKAEANLATDNWEDGHLHHTDSRIRTRPLRRSATKLPIAERLRHITWAWYTLTMSSGGIALLLHGTPHQFGALPAIGKAFYILDLVFFVTLTVLISLRFAADPPALMESLAHPTEGLFFPCFFISLSSILSCAAAYGVPACGPWLVDALWGVFWAYLAVTMLSAVVQFSVLFNGGHMPVHSMTPAWVLPVFPVMLAGVMAASLAAPQPPERALPMILAGVTCEAMGFMVSTFVYPLYFGRLMQDGLPDHPMRPAMFIAVGPPGFMTVALVGMGRAIPANYGYFATHPLAPEVLRILALWVGIWLWCLAFWFFAVSLVGVTMSALRWKLRFSMSWWTFVFPNVGFTLATGLIGQELDSEPVKWVCTAMTIVLVTTWFLVLIAQINAVTRHNILWPGRDEDRDNRRT